MFAVLSLLLLVGWVAAAALWVRSYFVESRIHRTYRQLEGRDYTHRRDQLTFRRGRIYWGMEWNRTELYEDQAGQQAERLARSGGQRQTHWSTEEIRPPLKWGYRGRFGFRRHSSEKSYRSVLGPYTTRNSLLMFPWGVVMALLGVMPLWWLVGVRRSRFRDKRRLAGLCVGCGYDLRATPERCPECGTPKATLPPPERGSARFFN